MDDKPRVNHADALLALQILEDFKAGGGFSEEKRRSITIQKEEPDHGGKTCGWNIVRTILLCGIVIFVVYGVLAVVIYLANRSEANNNKETVAENDHQGIEVCGADSFMLNDGLCDEITNNELCHWDGGDCCLNRGKKGESFCKVVHIYII